MHIFESISYSRFAFRLSLHFFRLQNPNLRQKEMHVKFITSYELFQNLCIDRHVLELAIRARCDIRVEPLDFSMSSFRKAAYRQFILWEHGYLGKGNRRIIPSCAVKKVREQYPAPDSVYMGFMAE